MAEPLKNQFNAAVPRKIAGMIKAVYPGFDSKGFVRDSLDGYDALNLMARGARMAEALRRHLPRNYERAIRILMKSLGPKLNGTENHGMAPFLYLPHVMYVANHGLGHFELSMSAQYELTQRFTAEFSIRPYIEKYPDATMKRLRDWTKDPNEHVRRLVSEGTRPRLPWAKRLPQFQKDPGPVLELLELLKDDPQLYVRRSVANNLNDIGKDHPAILVETAKRWMKNAGKERQWLVRHALRSAIKRAESGALAVLGFKDDSGIRVGRAEIKPRRVFIGKSVAIAFDVMNKGSKKRRVLVDFRVHFVKANGKTNPKVFKLKTLNLSPKETLRLQKTVSLAEMTTRKHYPGKHRVDVVLNGAVRPLASFTLKGKNTPKNNSVPFPF